MIASIESAQRLWTPRLLLVIAGASAIAAGCKPALTETECTVSDECRGGTVCRAGLCVDAPDATPVDAATPDAAPIDAASVDAATPDASAIDGSARDAASIDGTVPDVPDAGLPDRRVDAPDTGVDPCAVPAFDAAIPDGPAEVCNYADDDGDGLVDEGFQYVEVSGARRTVDEGTWVGVWSMTRGSADRIALSWYVGAGDPPPAGNNTIRVRVVDGTGAPVTATPPYYTTEFQPSNENILVWLGGEFQLIGTTRDYACGGDSSRLCATYLMTIPVDGRGAPPTRQLALDTPKTGGFFAANGEILIAFHPRREDVRVRSYTASGTGTIDRTLFALVPDEVVGVIRGTAGEDGEAYWVWNTNVYGTHMMVTGRDGALVRGPYVLRGRATTGDHHPIALAASRLHVVYKEEGRAYVGRWSRCGRPVGAPTQVDPVAGDDASLAMSVAPEGQIYVATRTTTAAVFLSRVSLTGQLLQPATRVFSSDGVGVAAVPEGALIAGSDYSGGHVYWTRFACPGAQ